MEHVDRFFAAFARDAFRRHEGERLAGANRRAHRAFASGCAVEAHVAFHHLLYLDSHLRDAEWTGQDAVVAGYAARLERRMYDAVFVLLDGVRRANLGARGI